ncbi:MAG: amino acid--tRNA ligase-related protein, partial [Pseudomonadota bacterium]
TMLEWYRSYVGLEAIQQELEELIQFLSGSPIPFRKATVADLFLQFTSYQLTPDTSREELSIWARELGLDQHPSDDWNDLFFRIFMEKVEAQIGSEPLFVYDFPSQQASLSKVVEGWSQRFELYWGGMELANAYLEVNDPQQNQDRFEKEANNRRASGKEISPFDEEYFRLLNQGMPPASGIAVGLDRLWAVLNSKNQIRW